MSKSQTASSHASCIGPNNLGPGSRRSFMRLGIAGFASMSLPGVMRLQAASPVTSANSSSNEREKTAVIMVWKPGGCSHIDTYDPKPLAGSEYRGPFSTIPTKVPGMQFTELLPRRSLPGGFNYPAHPVVHRDNDAARTKLSNLTTVADIARPGRRNGHWSAESPAPIAGSLKRSLAALAGEQTNLPRLQLQ